LLGVLPVVLPGVLLDVLPGLLLGALAVMTIAVDTNNTR
jgi:hypothetical protein